MGATTETVHLTGKATVRAKRSVRAIASVFGRTSAKMRMATVINAVAIGTARVPRLSSSTLVASEEARMFKNVLTRRMAPIIRSRSPISLLTLAARREPSFSNWNILPRETAVSAVSEPAKKADIASSKMIAQKARAAVLMAKRSSGGLTGNYNAGSRSGGQNVPDGVERHVPGGKGFAEATGQDEGELAAAGLLIVGHVLQQQVRRRPLAGDLGDGRGKARLAQVRLQPRGIVGRAETQADRKTQRQGHADGDTLAVKQPVGITGGGLQRVPEGMPQIEQGAVAGLTFVARHDIGLHPAGMGDGMDAGSLIAFKDFETILLKPRKEVGIPQRTVFDDLGIARTQLAGGQSRERIGVRDHDPRLVEQPDQVLALPRVDGGLAPHRGVDLGEQGGGDLREVDAPLEHARRETGEIADHPAAQRHDQPAAFDTHFEQSAGEVFQPREAFGAFARREHDGAGIEIGRLERIQHALQMKIGDVLVGDDGHKPARKRRDERAHLRKQPAADMDVVTAVVQFDGNALGHAMWPSSFSASTMCSTTCACGPSALSMARSASA